MPGKLTIPAAAIALIIGIMPARILSRRISWIACNEVCPSISRCSICLRCCQAVCTSLSMPSAIPFMVLPSNIPSNGMAYCGVYQGSARIMINRASRVITKEETNSDTRLMPNPQRRCSFRFCRDRISMAATTSITALMAAMSRLLTLLKTAFKISPRIESCTVVRTAAIASCRVKPSCILPARPIKASTSRAARPRSR